MFDRQGRIIKPARDRDGNDLVRKTHTFFFNKLNSERVKECC